METSSRRKSCDTCFRKKLRCDMLKPSCSNCLLYGVPCKTTSIRRKAAPPKPPPAADAPSQVAESSGSDGNSGLEARLARIEAKLDDLKATSSGGISFDEVFGGIMAHADTTAAAAASVSSGSTPSGSSATSNATAAAEPDHGFRLPPLLDVLPVVDSYFRQFNTAIPLFNQMCFMSMLNNYYSNPPPSSSAQRGGNVEWAAINVVLALGYCVRSIAGDDLALRFDDGKLMTCIGHVRRELDGLLERRDDLRVVQVLLGLSILHQGNAEQHVAAIWTSSALRLAHRMHLHTKSALADFSPDVARQRANIFWIAYFLDKDSSLRLRIPSFQLDEDIDLDLPGAVPNDVAGDMQSLDGVSRFNYLRSRVLIARIAGKIYDELYSNRSRRLSAEAQRQKVASLDRILDQWYRSIPEWLQAESLPQTVDKVAGSLMVSLNRAYLFCLVMLHGVYSLESSWIQKLGTFAVMVLQHAERNADLGLKELAPPLPFAWDKLVTGSRSSLKLYLSEMNGIGNLWPDARSNFTSYVILLANIVYHPLHDLVEHDRRLIRDAAKLTDRQLDNKGLEKFKQLQGIIAGLERLVDVAIDYARANGEHAAPYDVAALLSTAQSTTSFGDPRIENLDPTFNMEPQVPLSVPSLFDEPVFDSHGIGLDVPEIFHDAPGSPVMGWEF